MKATQMYWFMKLFKVSIPPIIINEIGTATRADEINTIIPVLAAMDRVFVSHIDGISTTKVINQPAPNGRGKYFTQNEFGTIFENRYWSGNKTMTNANKVPLIMLGRTLRFTQFSLYG